MRCGNNIIQLFLLLIVQRFILDYMINYLQHFLIKTSYYHVTCRRKTTETDIFAVHINNVINLRMNIRKQNEPLIIKI